MKNRKYAYYWIIVITLISGAFTVAYRDDLIKAHSLNFATPLVQLLNNLGAPLFERGPSAWYPLLGLLCASILAVGIITRDRSSRLFFSGALIAILTQFFLVDHSWQQELSALASPFITPTWHPTLIVGLCGYGLSCLLVLRALRGSRDFSLDQLQLDSPKSFSNKDLLVMVAIVVIAILFRVYALNHIVFAFEGELACYFAGATSLKGMFFANEGVYGPWAPLGLLFYLPIYLTTKIFGSTLLAVRLSSALVSIVTIPLLYLLISEIAGKRAGILAAFLFSMNCLHIGWGRTDVHPHGVTAWPSILLCLVLLKAAKSEKTYWYLLVAFMMGLAWHQYPSGQAAVTIPIIAICFHALNRGLPSALSWRRVLSILLGVSLWGAGLPLTRYITGNGFRLSNPFTLTGPRASWGSQDTQANLLSKATAVLSITLEHCSDFIQGLFYKLPYMFHQEWVPATEHLTSRSEAWIVVAFAMVGAFYLLGQRKRFETAVMFGWFVAALLPGILSSQAYAKRMSTVFAAIDGLAAIGIGSALMLVSNRAKLWPRIIAQASILVGMVCFIAYTSYVWFSERFWKYGDPPEIAMANELKESIPAGTIVISDLGQNYEPSKFTFLLLDYLAAPENRPNLISFYRSEQMSELIKDPLKAQSSISLNWVYVWTQLRDQATESATYSSWKFINFLIVDTFHNHAINSDEIQLAKSRCKDPTIRRIHSSANTPNWTVESLTSITCKISDLS